MNSHESIAELDMTVDELLVQLAGVRKRKLELAAEIKVCDLTRFSETQAHRHDAFLLLPLSDPTTGVARQDCRGAAGAQ